MKKVTFIMALAAAAGLASCTAQRSLRPFICNAWAKILNENNARKVNIYSYDSVNIYQAKG